MFQRRTTRIGKEYLRKPQPNSPLASWAISSSGATDSERDPHQTTSICWYATYGQGCRNDCRGNLDILSDASFAVVLHDGRGRVVRSRPPSTWCTGEPAARFAFVERAVMGPAARWSQQTSALIDSNRRTSESEHPVARRCFVALAIGIRELKQGWIAKGSRRSERIIAQLCVNGVCGQFKYRTYCATH